jgi:hypothetical protein
MWKTMGSAVPLLPEVRWTQNANHLFFLILSKEKYEMPCDCSSKYRTIFWCTAVQDKEKAELQFGSAAAGNSNRLDSAQQQLAEPKRPTSPPLPRSLARCLSGLVEPSPQASALSVESSEHNAGRAPPQQENLNRRDAPKPHTNPTPSGIPRAPSPSLRQVVVSPLPLIPTMTETVTPLPAPLPLPRYYYSSPRR